jgi:hypothetical protein
LLNKNWQFSAHTFFQTSKYLSDGNVTLSQYSKRQKINIKYISKVSLPKFDVLLSIYKTECFRGGKNLTIGFKRKTWKCFY